MTQRKIGTHSTAAESVSDTVVRAIADAKGIEPTDLDECLYDHVDPSALDNLCESATGANCSVSFRMAGFRVMIDRSQDVFLSPQVEETADADSARP